MSDQTTLPPPPAPSTPDGSGPSGPSEPSWPSGGGGPPPESDSRSGSSAMAVLGLVLVALGVLALLATFGVSLPLGVIVPSLIIVIGIGVMVSAIRGEPSGGVTGVAIALAVVLAVGGLFGAMLDVPVRGSVGDQRHVVAGEVVPDAEYRLLAGTLVLDLRDLDLSEGLTEVSVSTVLGEVRVLVPDDVAVSVSARVAAGDIRVLDEAHDGVGVNAQVTDPGFDTADTQLRLTVGVGLGTIRVER
jgi:hypothetical protein